MRQEMSKLIADLEQISDNLVDERALHKVLVDVEHKFAEVKMRLVSIEKRFVVTGADKQDNVTHSAITSTERRHDLSTRDTLSYQRLRQLHTGSSPQTSPNQLTPDFNSREEPLTTSDDAMAISPGRHELFLKEIQRQRAEEQEQDRETASRAISTGKFEVGEDFMSLDHTADLILNIPSSPELLDSKLPDLQTWINAPVCSSNEGRDLCNGCYKAGYNKSKSHLQGIFTDLPGVANAHVPLHQHAQPSPSQASDGVHTTRESQNLANVIQNPVNGTHQCVCADFRQSGRMLQPHPKVDVPHPHHHRHHTTAELESNSSPLQPPSSLQPFLARNSLSSSEASDMTLDMVPKSLLQDLQIIDSIKRVNKVNTKPTVQSELGLEGEDIVNVTFAMPTLWQESDIPEPQAEENDGRSVTEMGSIPPSTHISRTQDTDRKERKRKWPNSSWSGAGATAANQTPSQMRKPTFARLTAAVDSNQRALTERQNFSTLVESSKNLKHRINQEITHSRQECERQSADIVQAIVCDNDRRIAKLRQQMQGCRKHNGQKETKRDIQRVKQLLQRNKQLCGSYNIASISKKKLREFFRRQRRLSHAIEEASNDSASNNLRISESVMNLDGTDEQTAESMRKMIGFDAFGSTSGKSVPGNENNRSFHFASNEQSAENEAQRSAPGLPMRTHRRSSAPSPSSHSEEEDMVDQQEHDENATLSLQDVPPHRPAKLARTNPNPNRSTLSAATARIQQQVQHLTTERCRLVSVFPIGLLPSHHFDVGATFAHFYDLKQSFTADIAQEYWCNEVSAAAMKVVQERIGNLHRYNAVRDLAEKLMGLVAQARGIELAEVAEELGVQHL